MAITLRDNKEVYSTVEFQRWVGRTELDADERFVLSHYIRPAARTLEAGTGGGRILFALQAMGFTDLHGFDYVPGFIEQARAADPTGRIQFDVQDATKLGYASASFDQVIYVQQLLSFGDDARQLSAMAEAYRVLRGGGVALFSVLSFEVRRKSPVYRALMLHWRMLRWLRRSPLSVQAMPWMRLGDRFNVQALLDRGPYVHWFRVDELCAKLTSVGFAVEGIGSSRQIAAGGLLPSPGHLKGQPLDGAIYCVCRKPQD